jgi:hypothetical protein
VALGELVHADRDADIDVVVEGDTLALHLFDAAVDEVLFHLEVRDAVAQQTAGLGLPFIDVDRMACPGELLGRGHTCGA